MTAAGDTIGHIDQPPARVANDTAAVLVTHDGAQFLRRQCESIFDQTIRPALLVVVDDDSRDGTLDVLREIVRSSPVPIELIRRDGSNATDIRSRVASNFAAGLAAASDLEFALLSDQDDEWLADRLARQRDVLRSVPQALLVAGNAITIDEAGRPTGGMLDDVFPPPPGWESLEGAQRMRAVLGRPLVTGAASAIALDLFRAMSPVPRGWLHDRWASLVAAARAGLVLQHEPVIRYRLHPGQVVGLSQAQIALGGRRWQQVLARGSSPLDAARRATHVVRRLRPLAADPSIAAELTWPAVIASMLVRT